MGIRSGTTAGVWQGGGGFRVCISKEVISGGIALGSVNVKGEFENIKIPNLENGLNSGRSRHRSKLPGTIPRLRSVNMEYPDLEIMPRAHRPTPLLECQHLLLTFAPFP